MNYSPILPSSRTALLDASLERIADAQLVRRLADIDPVTGTAQFVFKHALVQDGAYNSLTRHERRRLHLLVAETLEQIHAGGGDENSALLAYHFEQADEPARALVYLDRAAGWAQRGAAFREEAELLRRAIQLAEALDLRDRLGELAMRRGQALLNVTEWRAAQADLGRALELVSPDKPLVRARILIDLAAASQWLWDIRSSMQYARQALALAEAEGDDSLAASAMTEIAVAQMSDGHFRESIAIYERAFARAGTPDTVLLVRALEYFGLCLYWLGQQAESLQRNHSAVERAHMLSDHVTIIRGMSNLGAAYAARGEYRTAIEYHQQACALAAKYAILPWWGRALSMQSGIHLDLCDFGGAEELIEQARSVARRASFAATIVGTGIDIVFCALRRGEVERAERIAREVESGIHTIYGSHRWLWEIRFFCARAELALAQEQTADAIRWADQALTACRKTGRRKYELLALLTRARARWTQERQAAQDDGRAAFALAQVLDDPALLLHVSRTLLQLEADPARAASARASRARILNALPESILRERFEAATLEWR